MGKAGGSTPRPSGVVRRSQVIFTWGPGALLDLPTQSVIVAGLDSWPLEKNLERIDEPRLSRMLGGQPLYAPPRAPESDHDAHRGIGAYRFPEWFVVQEPPKETNLSRRLVRLSAHSPGKAQYDGHAVVATRFVSACSNGHISDVPWRTFVHATGTGDPDGPVCNKQLWLDERGTGGDLSDLVVRCECGARRPLIEAQRIGSKALGSCNGKRPWLGFDTSEQCGYPLRLLNRFGANVYFPQAQRVLSLPYDGTPLDRLVESLMNILGNTTSIEILHILRQNVPDLAVLGDATDEEVLASILFAKGGTAKNAPVKQVELDALLHAPTGYGNDYPGEHPFFARRLPRHDWQHDPRGTVLTAVVQVHRLREVIALLGFSRIDVVSRDPITGEYDGSVEAAPLTLARKFFPAVENRGEGIFIQLDADAVTQWADRPAVVARIAALKSGYDRWVEARKPKTAIGAKSSKSSAPPFPGGAYIMLHTVAHLLMQSLAMRCGYPASALTERVYVDVEGQRFGFLIYTATADTDGTLGGLVAQAYAIEDHLFASLEAGGRCSNDPVCALHDPKVSLEQRFLHGAACHGCTLVGETSCEQHNDFLDRALVVPVIGLRDAAFFRGVG